MQMKWHLGKLLSLAEMARADRTLLPNHGVTVARMLRRKLADVEYLLKELEPYESESYAAELLPGLREDRTRIRHALEVYEPNEGLDGRA